MTVKASCSLALRGRGTMSSASCLLSLAYTFSPWYTATRASRAPTCELAYTCELLAGSVVLRGMRTDAKGSNGG